MLVTNRGFDDPRVCMEAEALADSGRRVTVVGWDRDVDRTATLRQRNVDFLRLHLRSTHGRGVTQTAFVAGFWCRAWAALRRLRPGVIHCHDLDTLPVGWLAARSLRAHLVFDAHENFPDMMAGHLPAPAVAALRGLERFCLPRCDLVITVGQRLAEHLRRTGARTVAIVGNWKHPDAYRFAPEAVRKVREDLSLPDGTVAVCYITNLGPERRLEALLAAVAADRRFACVVGGDGPQADLARKYAAAHRNVTYLGRVPPDRVPLITASCDVIYSGYDQAKPNAHWGAPNKMYEAIAAGKPLLANDFGEIGEVVRTEGCGVLADTDSADSIAEGLNRLADGPTRAEMGRRAAGLQRRFCRDRANASLLDAYRRLGGTRPSAGAAPAPSTQEAEA